MKWRIDYSRDAEKFIEKQNIRLEVREELKKFLMKIKGENVNVDIKKLSGEWEGYYRLRKGKLGIFARYDPKTEELVGLTIINFSKKFGVKPKEVAVPIYK